MALKMVMVLVLSAFAIAGKLSQPPPRVRGQPRETTEKLPQPPRFSFLIFFQAINLLPKEGLVLISIS